MVGIVYGYLPLMVFPIYVGLEKLDKRLLEASADLCATPVGSFLQVTLPLSAPGVVTGCMLVFILLMGEYLIPALLGGGKVFFVGNALVDLFLQSRNWPFGAACAVALVAIMLVTVTLYMRVTLKSGTMRDQSLDLAPCGSFGLRDAGLSSSSTRRSPSSCCSASAPGTAPATSTASRCNGTRPPPATVPDQGRAGHSLIVAAASSALATVVGTAAALALPRIAGPFRVVFDALTYVAIMVPGIVIGIATLIALVTAFEVLNPTLAALWPGDPAASPQLHMGLGSVILAHSVFATALVIMLVRARLLGMDRSLLEASSDLYATPWGTFRQVTLPMILPAVIAGFLLSFTFSLDDYVVASFVAGPTVTLPIYIFASVRRGVTPEINAIGTVVLSVSLLLLFGSLLLLRRGQRAGAATSKA